MSDAGPDTELAPPMPCREGADSEFILLVAPAWQNRLPIVLALLEDAGAEVTAMDRECGVLQGRVGTDCLQALSELAQVASLGWRQTGTKGC